MILIKKVEIAHIPDDKPFAILSLGDYEACGRSTREHVTGRIYTVPGGGKVCIGISEQARGALGITLEAVENEIKEMERQVWDARGEALRAETNAEIRHCRKFNNMSTWGRIKHVFKDYEKRLENFFG